MTEHYISIYSQRLLQNDIFYIIEIIASNVLQFIYLPTFVVVDALALRELFPTVIIARPSPGHEMQDLDQNH